MNTEHGGQNFREILTKFNEDENATRLIFRIVSCFGPIDVDSLCLFCTSVFFCSNHFPNKGFWDKDLVFNFFCTQYDINILSKLEQLKDWGYVEEVYDWEIKYKSRDAI